ncbi:MAG: MFS transporter [Tatlockia sp.]|nr:MFS transporter [Tatlockia sp.]
MFEISKKTIISGAIGNTLEVYDYMIWSFFSVYLAKEFLPPQSKLSDIFFLFFLTYILRPIGGLLAGILADQIGRKKILTLSIFLMGFCTTIVGILPSYEKIGIISVLLLLFIRFFQVFAVSSEYISSISLLIESCKKEQRGYFGSWAAFGINFGMLISSVIGAILLYLIDIKILPAWGWRFAFLLAFFTTIIGFWIRRSIPESFEFIRENARREQRDFFSIFRETIFTIKGRIFESFLIFVLVCFGVSTTVLIFVFAPIYMSTFTQINNTQSFIINSSGLFSVVILIPFFGYISDFIGRTKLIACGITALLLLILPYFELLSTGNFGGILLAHIIIGIPCASIFAVIPVFITEIFPISIRCSTTNLLYSIASCLGGGVTPLLAFKLSNYGHYNFLPGLILVVLGITSLVLLSKFKKIIKRSRGSLNLVYPVKMESSSF